MTDPILSSRPDPGFDPGGEPGPSIPARATGSRLYGPLTRPSGRDDMVGRSHR